MSDQRINVEEIVAESMRAREQCRVFIDILRTFPRYAGDVEVLASAPHRVPDFIQARRAIGDTAIEEAIQLASDVAEALGLDSPPWTARSPLDLQPVRTAGAGATGAILKLPTWRIDAQPANEPSFRLRVGAADDGNDGGGTSPRDNVIIEEVRQDGELFRVQYMRGLFSPRVQVEVRVANPARLRAGDTLVIPLNAEGPETRIEVELEPDGKGLAGRGIFNLDWEDFSRSRRARD